MMSNPQNSQQQKHFLGGSSGSNYHPFEQPSGTRRLFKADPLTAIDEAIVIAFSLTVFSSIVWVPWTLYLIYNYWKKRYMSRTDDDDNEKSKRRKKLVGYAILLSLVVAVTKPYANPKVGRWLSVRRWRVWTAWLNYTGMEVLLATNGDNKKEANISNFDYMKDQAIFAVVPHGLFPFPLALAAIPERIFGFFRPVVATATSLFPFVREILGFLDSVDATKSVVDKAIRNKDRIGLSPGGIAEMFVPMLHPNKEYALLAQRKGFIKMSIKHNVPVIPIYVFGGTKMFHRLILPTIFEDLSKWLKLSICIFYGRLGLPIPFRQKLLYVMGNPLFPPSSGDEEDEQSESFKRKVDEFHKLFCNRIVELFERYKQYYGWEHKDLCII